MSHLTKSSYALWDTMYKVTMQQQSRNSLCCTAFTAKVLQLTSSSKIGDLLKDFTGATESAESLAIRFYYDYPNVLLPVKEGQLLPLLMPWRFNRSQFIADDLARQYKAHVRIVRCPRITPETVKNAVDSWEKMLTPLTKDNLSGIIHSML